MSESLEQRVRQLEITMHGPMGDNGIYGNQKAMDAKIDRIEGKIEGLYKALALASITFLTTGVGVVVTLLTAR